MNSRFYSNGLGNMPPSSVIGKPTLKLTQPYTKGAAVMDAQRKLVEAGYPMQPYGVDGTFGPKTRAAVKQFQARNGIEATGIIDTETWMALYAVVGDRYPAQNGGGSGPPKGDPPNWIKWGAVSIFVIGAGFVISKN